MVKLSPAWVACAALLVAGLPAAGQTAMPAQPQVAPRATQAIVFVPHRAVYDLSLAKRTDQSSVSAVRGRIVYDFSGNACQGYALSFRQVTEVSVSGGDSNVSDLRSSTFEDDAGHSFKFSSQNYLNQRLDTSIDGKADRGGSAVAVSLTSPKTARFDLPHGVVFPTGQMKGIVAAALAGQSVYESQVYDGSDGGQKTYNTLAVIGRLVDPARPRDGAAAGRKELDGVPRWPVTISYFDSSKGTMGEQTPVYALSFQVYANGLSTDIRLDYGDFALKGVLASLDFLPQGKCP